MRVLTVVFAGLLISGGAQAGCLTGAAIGGVAGHYAGHHGLLGAGAGCIAGHMHSKHAKQRAAQQANDPNGAYPAQPAN